MTFPVLSMTGAPVGTVELRGEVFGPVRVALLHQAVTRELADRRVGTHDTRGRSEVSGGGRKPWRQKGTGRARQGSTRATQWKGGGKPFGPTPRSYAQDLPRSMRREALRSAVAAKMADEAVMVIEGLEVRDGRTKTLVSQLSGVGVAGVPLVLVMPVVGDLLARAARNVPWLTVETPAHLSAYQLVRAQRVVFDRAALQGLEEALAR